MPHPSKSNVSGDKNPRHGGKDTNDGDVPPSPNLWVGNLSNETTDEDLLEMFAEHGVLDSVTTYSSRNFAFVYFKHLDDARSAKDALQGTVLLGNAIKIEFARPARPGKHLWVGGISSSVSEKQIVDEFLKFGKIEEFKFSRDRNTMLVDYYRSEDAAAALKSMNGKRLGGELIRVDFLRSQPPRRENRSGFHDSRDGHFNSRRSMGPPDPLWMSDAMRNFPDSSQFGPKRHLQSQPSGGRRGEGQPSKILWVGYPPSIQMDEQMLHNAMILFGEIERIKSFPSRHYSFVEFRSVDEARRAKEGLQGRLFNDPRIQIMFSSSELAPGKDSPNFVPGIKGPRPDMFFSMTGPNMLMRAFGPQGGFDQLLSGPEMLNDLAGLLNNFQDTNNSMGPSWRRLSPSGAGILPSPVLGMRPPVRPMSNSWDGSDVNPFQRESKRTRIDGPSPTDDASFPGRKFDNHGTVDAQGQSRHSPLGMRRSSGGPSGQGLPDSDLCWRGVIAKGGTPVCHARCIPIGKGIDSPLPEVVNCSARTGLDMLTKHFAEASGFDIVFFLPDSEDDFASYTEFLRYLGAKNRAGVAKFDDGTTMFLVPPSDFLTKVLNVPGPERLYGVVLQLPQQMPSSAPVQQQSQQPIPPSQYIDREQLPPSQTDYGLLSQKEQVFQMDYNRLIHEDSINNPPKQLLQHPAESLSMHSAPLDYASNLASMPQAGVSLTPELLATLASLLPANMQTSVSTRSQLPSAQTPTTYPASMTPDKGISAQGWRQDQVNITSSTQHSREEQTAHQSQQLGHQYNTQASYMSQLSSYANVTNGAENPSQAIHGSSQIQDLPLNFPQQGAVSSRMPSNFGIPSQGGQFTVPQQVNQQFQYDGSHNSQKSYGTAPATDATGLFRSPAFQQHNPPVTSSTQLQVQQLQSALSGTGQGSTDGEIDKNQRYQSTLQFAASLLLQIQQQQQGNTQAAQGSGHHQ